KEAKNMEILVSDDKKYYPDCVKIRETVFVQEQNVPLEMEIDEYEDECVHVLLLLDNEPAGTVRYRKYDDTTVKIERMAVLKEHRGKHFGMNLMYFVHLHAKSKGFTWAKLGAQTHAIPFYEKIGYQVSSGEFDDAGIPHVDMICSL